MIEKKQAAALAHRAQSIVLAAIVLFGGTFRLSSKQLDLGPAKQRAKELQAVIRRDSRFADVRVTCLHNSQLVVVVQTELSTPVMSDLKRFVAQHGPPETIIRTTYQPDRVQP